MKHIRAFISITITAVLMLGLLPAQALAEDPFEVPTTQVTTGQAECIGSDSVAIALSEFIAGPIENISEFGIEIATEQDFSDAVRHAAAETGSLFFVSGLIPETTYYYRAYMLDEDENVYYGADEFFDTPAEAAIGTVRESRQAILTEIAYMNALLAPYGLNVGELASLPEKDAGFYEELARYANISVQDGTLDFSSMPTADTTPGGASSTPTYSGSAANSTEAADEATLFGKRFEYAYYIAGVNKVRDPDAGDLEDEVVYMYLSHYIDMIPADVGTAVDYNSNDRKFSAWITYYDREVYDSYLNVSGADVAADKMRAAAAGLADLGSSASDLAGAAASLTKSATALQVATTVAGSALTAEQTTSLADALVEVKEALNDDKTPEEVIEGIYDGLDGHNYGKEIEGFIVSTAISISLDVAFGTLAATGPIGLLVGTAIFAVNLCSMAYLDMTHYVAWLGMGYSLSGRIPGRMLRYYGMW
jgi:hypothetical protein